MGGIGAIVGGAQMLGGLLGGGGPRAPRCNQCQQQQMQQFPQANMACAGNLNNGCQRVNGCCNSFMGSGCGNSCHGPCSQFGMNGGGFGGDPWGVGGGQGFGNPWFQPNQGLGFGGGLSFPPSGLPNPLGLPMPSVSLALGINLG